MQLPVSIDSGNTVLDATVTMPRGYRRAFALLIGGSGPTRQSGLSLALEESTHTRPFAEWSRRLARCGIASLRYSKRHSFPGNTRCLGIADEYGEDVTACVSFLRENILTYADRLLFIGHSLGSVAALEYGAAEDAVQGIVCVAGPLLDLPSVMRQQATAYLTESGSTSDEIAVHIRKELVGLENVLRGFSDESVFGIPAEYWTDYAGRSLPTLMPLAGKKKVPLLAVLGGCDQLVRAEDWTQFCSSAELIEKVTCATVPYSDHFLARRSKVGKIQYDLRKIIQWVHHQFL